LPFATLEEGRQQRTYALLTSQFSLPVDLKSSAIAISL
jgi:hypothetical protein